MIVVDVINTVANAEAETGSEGVMVAVVVIRWQPVSAAHPG